MPYNFKEFKFSEHEIAEIRSAYQEERLNLDALAQRIGHDKHKICTFAKILGLTNLCRKKRTILRGPQSPNWEGEAAQRGSKRVRARKLYDLGKCERCKAANATDRHHKDDDTGNNARSNIMILCRRCHMTVDGRLQILIDSAPERGRKLTKPPSPCTNCGALAKPLRKGQCPACDMFQRRTGRSRAASTARRFGLQQNRKRSQSE